MTETAFGDRLGAVFADRGQLCLGIDPHRHLLDRWDLNDSADGALRFGLGLVTAATGRVGVVKPQVAFFERFGAAGYAALERVIEAARSAGLLVIADAKRGDVGTSVDAYAEAWLAPGSPLESDAVTVSPYQGWGSLAGVFSLARQAGKGVFVLAATSNPEAAAVQGAVRADGVAVAASVVADADAANAAESTGPIGSIGVVYGATLGRGAYGIADPGEGPVTPLLVPGFGAQGASVRDARAILGARADAAVLNESRALASDGVNGAAVAIERRTEEVRDGLAR